MPLTDLAASNQLGWLDSVVAVALLSFLPEWGPGGYPYAYEIQSDTYARCPVAFGAPADGVRQATTICQFVGLAGWTVRWYGLVDAEENFLAIIPHCAESEFSNQPKVCYFIDTVDGWIEAPDHVLSVGQNILFMTGPTTSATTFPDAVSDPLGGLPFETETYNTLSTSISQYGPFKIWVVAEVEDYRFRVIFYDGAEDVFFVPTYTGWGYYQRIDPQPYESDTNGSLTITALRIAGYG